MANHLQSARRIFAAGNLVSPLLLAGLPSSSEAAGPQPPTYSVQIEVFVPGMPTPKKPNPLTGVPDGTAHIDDCVLVPTKTCPSLVGSDGQPQSQPDGARSGAPDGSVSLVGGPLVATFNPKVPLTDPATQFRYYTNAKNVLAISTELFKRTLDSSWNGVNYKTDKSYIITVNLPTFMGVIFPPGTKLSIHLPTKNLKHEPPDDQKKDIDDQWQKYAEADEILSFAESSYLASLTTSLHQ